jgi:hypothetical protein
MPNFVIERQYLVPMYQHIVVEAETLEEEAPLGIARPGSAHLEHVRIELRGLDPRV